MLGSVSRRLPPSSARHYARAMRYWWVNQNQTYRHEIAGGYLWSPKRNANGARNPFYEAMREVAPGDLVFSFVDTRIPAVGIAQSYCWESPKLLPLPSRRDAAGEFSRHQQKPDQAGVCSAVQEHADPGPPVSPQDVLTGIPARSCQPNQEACARNRRGSRVGPRIIARR